MPPLLLLSPIRPDRRRSHRDRKNMIMPAAMSAIMTMIPVEPHMMMSSISLPYQVVDEV